MTKGIPLNGAARKRPEGHEIQGYFCPLQRPKLLERRLQSGKCIRTDLGFEKLCNKCQLYWPMDTEFWFPSRTEDGLFNWCRACYCKQRWPERGAAASEDASWAVAELAQAVSQFTHSPAIA